MQNYNGSSLQLNTLLIASSNRSNFKCICQLNENTSKWSVNWSSLQWPHYSHTKFVKCRFNYLKESYNLKSSLMSSRWWIKWQNKKGFIWNVQIIFNTWSYVKTSMPKVSTKMYWWDYFTFLISCGQNLWAIWYR